MYSTLPARTLQARAIGAGVTPTQLDFSSIFTMMLPIMMLGMMARVMSKAFSKQKEESSDKEESFSSGSPPTSESVG